MWTMMLKSRCNPRSGWRNGLLDQWMSWSKIKLLLTVLFFNCKGSVHYEFYPWSGGKETAVPESFCNVRDAVHRKRPG